MWLVLWFVEKVYGVSVSVRGYKLLAADEVVVKNQDYELVGLHVCSRVSRDYLLPTIHPVDREAQTAVKMAEQILQVLASHCAATPHSSLALSGVSSECGCTTSSCSTQEYLHHLLVTIVTR